MARSVTFWGAAQCVTGSMHLIEDGRERILLDCGLSHGPRSDRRDPHPFPFVPAKLDAVVISHAHMDHCGLLPILVHQGFGGPIYCTPATAELLGLMLRNSARIQDEEAYIAGVLGEEPAEGYARTTRRDVDRILHQCVPVSYDQEWSIGSHLRLRFVDAGHILGSAMVVLTALEAGETRRLTFTGDLGRCDSLLLRDPSPVPAADLLISESTYGGRVLDSPVDAGRQLEEVVRRTLERGGKILIPTFSLGRTQVIAYVLSRALQEKRIPESPIYVDSPLATAIAGVYRRHPQAVREEVQKLQEGGDFLGEPWIRYVQSHEESKEMTHQRGPCVIIAPSGMCEGGRIVYHLKHHVDDPRCSIVLVNFQAPGTPGRRLLERGPTIRLHGKNWNKWADIVYLAGFSGHADQHDLRTLLGSAAKQTGKVCLVHGEVEQATALAGHLREAGFRNVSIPQRGETVAW